ncbi:hypothetical protein V8C44DRAFT_349027 [Trichoderma aethiopicum]
MSEIWYGGVQETIDLMKTSNGHKLEAIHNPCRSHRALFTMESLFGRDFASPEDARAAIDAAAQSAGYSFTKHRSRPNSVEFRCSKGRNFKSQQNPDLPESRRRQTSSQMTGCPCKIVVSRQHALARWVIRRTRNEDSNGHNHPAFPSAAHCRYRNMAIERRKESILELYHAGVKPMQILKELQLDAGCHAEGLTRVGFRRATERQRLLAATKDGRVGKTLELLTPKEAFGDGMTFPGPLVLPDDDLAEDPEWPSQDFREWRDEEERNPVTSERKTIYIVPSPSISLGVSKMQAWSACSSQSSTSKDHMQAAEPPKLQDLIDYLSAFFHGMPVKLSKTPFQWQKWNKYDGAIVKSPDTQRRIGLRTPGDRLFGIRCRASPDGVSPMQVNLDDVLDALAENIPADAHSVMMLLDLDMYEGDGDIFTAGRAYGGSRIAAVSLFRDQPLCTPPDDGHAWPASHCADYIDKLCQEAASQPPVKKKAKLQPTSRRARTGTSGPLDRAIKAVQTTAAEASSSGISRPARPDAAAAAAANETAQWLGRTAVTMAHELCHCLGLDHCAYFACAMQGCGSVGEAQRQPPYLCPVCLEKLCRAIGEGVVDGWEGDRGVRERFVRESTNLG